MTISDQEAFEAMLAHHQDLEEQVRIRAAAISRSLIAEASYEVPTAELLYYLTSEVLPHALAEEQSVYRVASTKEKLATTIAGMIEEHRTLAALTERLARATSGEEAYRHAEMTNELFTTHVAKENELILPVLLAEKDVSLALLLAQMHQIIEAAAGEGPVNEATETQDSEKYLLSLLIDAAKQLARSGAGDQACKLAASAWVSLHVSRPDLGVRITAALHDLVRSLTSEPVSLRTKVTGNSQRNDDDLDVRTMPPAKRHDSIFAAYRALHLGESFILINDHDPKPLRYQFEAEHAGKFIWDTLEAGPDTWRVRIGSTSFTADVSLESDEGPGVDEP